MEPAKTTGDKEAAASETIHSIPPKHPRMAMQQTRNQKKIMGTKLPIVMSILQSKNYLPKVIKSLRQMEVKMPGEKIKHIHQDATGKGIMPGNRSISGS
jgi:hypothetical protein